MPNPKDICVGYTERGGRYYKKSPTDLDWNAAMDYCAADNAILPTFDNGYYGNGMHNLAACVTRRRRMSPLQTSRMSSGSLTGEKFGLPSTTKVDPLVAKTRPVTISRA